MIKDIVVNLGLGERDPAGDFAISVAEAFEAHVSGHGLRLRSRHSWLGHGRHSAAIHRVATRRIRKGGAARDRPLRAGRQARRRFLSKRAASTPASPAPPNRLGRLARRFDLVIVGQPDRDKSAPVEVVDEGVLFESGRPVIFVPYIQKADLKLDRVMVCWDGSRAATRAVADSLPFLKKAKQVEIVIVASKAGKNDEVPGVDLGQHLARHGLKVDVKRITSPDIDVPSTILSYAADSSADMIVMGGYGHSRLREFILGGVTRGILETMTIPALMSH